MQFEPAQTGLFFEVMKVTIFYSVSAPAGSGKTYALVEHAIALAQNNQKVMIAQPTKPLLDQTERDIRAGNGNVKLNKIVSTTTYNGKSSVTDDILDFMKDSQPGQGEILLISQQALSRLPKAFRADWTLFVDEVPGAFEKEEMNIAMSHRYITDYLSVGEALVGKIVVVQPQDVGNLRNLSANKSRDAAYKLFKNLADHVLNDDRIVCVDSDAYAELVSGSGKRKSIDFFSFLKPEFVSGFASVTVMGANFDETELAKIWEKTADIQWKPHPVISKNLRYLRHNNGSRLTIKYVIDGNWSQYFGGQPFEDGTIHDGIVAVMAAELGEEFLWQANVKHGDFVFDYGDMLPQVSHGLNRASFQKKNGVALLKAINHSTGPAAFLKELGLTQDELKITLQYQNEYQAMMRCSLRDPLATDDVTVCVVSKGSALWLQGLFPNSTIEKLESVIPEPRPTGQPAEVERPTAQRMWESRENRKVRDAATRGEVYVARPWVPKTKKIRF